MGEDATTAQKPGLAPKKVLGIFALAMINVAAVLSIRNFPSMAEFGWSSIGWYIIGTILFLIPLSLAGAELATMLSDKGGGVYAWCKEAFGTKGGFVAVFCEWSNNLVWFPTVLAFIASTLAFAISPALGTNAVYLFVVMMIAFWGTTAIAYFGENVSSKFQNVGVILGSIIPSILIIGLGVYWITSGSAIVLPPFTWAQVVPTFDLSTLPFFATVILLFAGMEMAGFHALEIRNPNTDFPKAMAISAVIIFFCTVMATLAIAFVIPANELSLVSRRHAGNPVLLRCTRYTRGCRPDGDPHHDRGGCLSCGVADWTGARARGGGTGREHATHFQPYKQVRFTRCGAVYPGTDRDVCLPALHIPAVD